MKLAHRIRGEPPLVVAAHRCNTCVAEHATASRDITAAIDHLANREDAIDTGCPEKAQRAGEARVFAVDVADCSDAS